MRRPASRPLLAVGLAVPLVIFLLLAVGITLQSRERVLEAARSRTQTMAGMLNQHAVKTVDAVDMLLRMVARELGPDPQNPAKRSSVTALLAELTRNQPYVRGLKLFERETGAELFDFASRQEISSDAEIDSVEAHQEHGRGSVHIGRPFLDAGSRSWLVRVSRRVSASEGIPGNVVAAYVALDYFQRVYDEVDLGEQGSIVLFRPDGIVLVRRPYDAAIVGRDLSNAKLFWEQLPRGPVGTYETVSASDQIERLVSYRKVDALPLVVLVGLSKSEVTAAWRRDAMRDLAIGSTALIALIALGSALAQLNRQRAKAEDALRVTLDTMEQGLLMFDDTNAVRVCNRRAIELLDLPADLMESKPRFSDLIAYQKTSDEFKDADATIQSLAQAGGILPEFGVYERRRPNGTLLEVRTVEVPGGGAVRTFADVTARREAEDEVRVREERYRALVTATSSILWRAAPDGTIVEALGWSAYSGQGDDTFYGNGWLKAVHPEDCERAEAEWRAAVDRGQPSQLEYRIRRADGEYRWVLDQGAPIRNPDGSIREWVGTVSDVHERKLAEDAQARSEARYRLLAEHSTDMIIQADLDTTRRYVSPSCRELLGFEPEELTGFRPSELIHPDDMEALGQVLRAMTSGKAETGVTRQRQRRKDGSWIWTEATLRLIRDASGAPAGYVAAIRDISERRQLEEQLLRLARTDGLTGLLNRRAFEERLDEEWRRALRTRVPFALLTLDVDFFKQFNDHFGHGAGDDCLKTVANLLESSRRATDFVARMGGEEFMVLLPATDLAGAGIVAEAIRSSLEEAGIPHPKSPHGVVTASIGVATFDPPRTGSIADVLNASDRAMYDAKREGRNRVVCAGFAADPASTRLRDRHVVDGMSTVRAS